MDIHVAAQVFDDRFFTPFQAAVTSRATELTPQGLANCAWALAALRDHKNADSTSTSVKNTDTTTTTGSMCGQGVTAATRRELAGADLAGCVPDPTSAGVVGAETIRSLTAAAVQCAGKGFGTPQNVCSVLHSLALLGVFDPVVFKTCGLAAVPQMAAFSASDVATLVVAFGKATVTMPNPLLLACEQHLVTLYVDAVGDGLCSKGLFAADSHCGVSLLAEPVTQIAILFTLGVLFITVCCDVRWHVLCPRFLLRCRSACCREHCPQ